MKLFEPLEKAVIELERACLSKDQTAFYKEYIKCEVHLNLLAEDDRVKSLVAPVGLRAIIDYYVTRFNQLKGRMKEYEKGKDRI